MSDRRERASPFFLIVMTCILAGIAYHMAPTTPQMQIIRGLLWFGAGYKIFELFCALPDYLYNALLRRKAQNATQNHGSARFAKESELQSAGLFKTDGLFFGLSAQSGKPIFSDFTHALINASTGSGKTRCFVIPNLLHCDESMVVTDLHPEVAVVTKPARERQHGHVIHCLNPAHQDVDKLGLPSCFNPVDVITQSWECGWHKDVIDDAINLVGQVIPEPAQSSENKFFREAGRKIIAVLLVYLVVNKGRQATLTEVLESVQEDLIMRETLYNACTSDVLQGDLARMTLELIPKIEAQDTRQWESFREHALQALAPYHRSGWLGESTGRSDFSFADLKNSKQTVYILTDATRMDIYQPWLGLVVWCALLQLSRCRKKSPSVIFMLDEVANFKVTGLIKRMTELRSLGIKLVLILQSFNAFAQSYGKDNMEIVREQCDLQAYFGIQSYDTASIVSKTLGNETIVTDNYQLGHMRYDPVTVGASEKARPIRTESEIMQSTDVFLLKYPLPPIRSLKCGYDEVSPWWKWARPNPLYGAKRFKSKIRLRLKY